MSHIVAPHQDPIVQSLRSVLPNHPIINDQLVAFAFVIAFIGRIGTLTTSVAILGIPLTILAVFFEAMWSRENEEQRQLHTNTNLANSNHQPWGSFWQNPRDGDQVIIENSSLSDEESEEDRNFLGVD